MIHWATIIGSGVYNSWKTPNGPLFANKKYTIKPTTTGGMPIRAFKIIIIIPLKLKFFMAKKNPLIKPNNEEINNEVRLTLKDKKMISYKLGSRENINLKEFIIISRKLIILFYYKKNRCNIF